MRNLSVLLIVLTAMASVSCDKNKDKGDNPFFAQWDTPFGMPPFDRIRPEHYKPAFERGMEMQIAEIDSIVSNVADPTFDNVILALDNSGDLLGAVGRVFGLVSSADTNEALQKVEEEVMPMMASHSNDIYLNEALFNKVAEVYAKRESAGFDDLQKRLTEKIYDRFLRSGALLPADGKQRLREIDEKLSTARMRFGNNILEANRKFRLMVDSADVADLPEDLKRAAAAEAEKAGEKGRYAFTLSKPSMIPFLTSSGREDLRRMLYEGYLNRCNYGDSTDNRALVNEIVGLRGEKAKLLGYATHADYMLADRMAESPAAVYATLDQLWEPALQRAKEELERLKTIKRDETGSDIFHSWDWWYYAEKLRKQEYSLDEQMLLPYFPLENVQRGIFELCNRLWGLTFRPLVNMPVYNKECSVYEAFDADNTHLGVLIFDFFPRDGKAVGAWCGSYRDRTYRGDEKVADPIVTVVCNFTRPTGSRPALLNLDETETFFHEFGHAVHALMTDVPYQGLGGVEQDFVELPSQIMENWATEPEMLRNYALHYSTKVPIPEALISKIVASSHFNQGFTTTELLAASYIDMDIHTLDPFDGVDVNEFESLVLNVRRGLIPEIAPRYRFPYFKHIFDSESYSAGYYSYIWAEVLDKDAYEAFVSSGDKFSKTVAARFREFILSKGGSQDGMTMYRNFRGGDPSGDYLLYARGLKERPGGDGNYELVPLPDDEVPPMDHAELFGPGSPRNQAPITDSIPADGERTTDEVAE